MNDKTKELYDLLNNLLMSYQIVANDKDKMKLSRYYKTLNDFIIEYKTLQSNWNSLREYIEENKKVATEYTKKVELSGLCQGDYPVTYYHAIKRIDLDNLYLDKMNELERGKDE